MSDDAKRYQQIVERAGMSTTQKQALDWVPNGSRVLELGCSTGYMGEFLIKHKDCDVSAIEVDADMAAEARHRGLHVVEGSLEDEKLRREVTGRFDVIMATDVIEHLRAPEPVLSHMLEWLAPKGQAIISVPNVATWSMRIELMRGRFEYQDSGILDRTHLRFFTWDTIHHLVQNQGWVIEDHVVDCWEVPGGQSLFFDLPHHLHKTLIDGAASAEVNHGPARTTLMKFLGAVTAGHQKLGRQLGRYWPNLCAKHIGLLMRPAAASPEPSSSVTSG